MERINITDREEYDLCKKRGFEPLFDDRFEIDINLRKEIQYEQVGFNLGYKERTKSNQKFYGIMWENKDHHCEECGIELPEYSSTYISHILSRGAFPEFAYDTRNVNILCPMCHRQWETGKREKMKIYAKNCKTIETLKSGK